MQSLEELSRLQWPDQTLALTAADLLLLPVTDLGRQSLHPGPVLRPPGLPQPSQQLGVLDEGLTVPPVLAVTARAELCLLEDLSLLALSSGPCLLTLFSLGPPPALLTATPGASSHSEEISLSPALAALQDYI